MSDFATPWTVAYQASPSREFSRQEYWSGLPFPSPGDIPDPGIKPRYPELQAVSLPPKPPGKTSIRSPFLLSGIPTGKPDNEVPSECTVPYLMPSFGTFSDTEYMYFINRMPSNEPVSTRTQHWILVFPSDFSTVWVDSSVTHLSSSRAISKVPPTPP